MGRDGGVVEPSAPTEHGAGLLAGVSRLGELLKARCLRLNDGGRKDEPKRTGVIPPLDGKRGGQEGRDRFDCSPECVVRPG